MPAHHPGQPKFTIAIVGGGFSGTALAANLLRQAAGSVSVVVIEKHGLPGRGVAYGTQYSWHLLNVPAGNMSVYPDQPDHFLRWAQKNYDPEVGPRSFLPRRVYGQYVESVLLDAAAQGGLLWKRDEVRSIASHANGVEIKFRSGGRLLADKVVLALGNFPPSDPALPGRDEHASPRYAPFAWSGDALVGLESAKDVLLVGSGLTAIDQVLALRAREFRGTIHILSRRGLLPHSHKASASWPLFWNANSPRTARALLRLVRRQIEDAHRQEVDWRAVIDSLRPVTARVWQSLDIKEKKRFLRHVRPYWEVHRHRIAPDIAQLIAGQLEGGQIRLHAGRITRYAESVDRVDISYRKRENGDTVTLAVDRVINCTGPETDCRHLDDPLIASLRTSGLVRPDPLYLGLDVSSHGAVIGVDGIASDVLYAVGPARKGNLWESTAVPEIRTQAAELAEILLIKQTQPGPLRDRLDQPEAVAAD
jgi:uncharacterized NAD(P)/FAD-binding protein YdhS